MRSTGSSSKTRSISRTGTISKMRAISKRGLSAVAAAALLPIPVPVQAASHREAPVTALDRTADITDFYAFVSPDDKTSLTAILCTDPLLEPGNGPNYFPFDNNVLYEIKIDNDHDAITDVKFEFLFETEVRAPAVPVALIGVGPAGLKAPNGPPPIPVAPLQPPELGPGMQIVPPTISALDGPGSEGLNLRQKYTVWVTRNGLRRELRGDGPLFAVPSNAGPRTMENYESLYAQGVNDVRSASGLTTAKVWAGTADDAFYIDLGAAFDSLNFRIAVLDAAQDADDKRNYAPDEVSGYNVNCIAIQVPIRQLTEDGNLPSANDEFRQIGLWGTTSRAEQTVREKGKEDRSRGKAVQVQRMANPLINELLIGTGYKNLWSRSEPKDDKQFQDQLFDPLIVRVGQAAFNLPIPNPPRLDLAPLVQYTSGKPGPIADLLRVDLTVKPTLPANRKRLGGCGGDAGGFPNGRRLGDDVTDCFLRVGFGLLAPGFSPPALGDGVNVNDMAIREVFPFFAPAQSGRNSRHVDPNEPGCQGAPGGLCPL
jgi:hypothetical protein